VERKNKKFIDTISKSARDSMRRHRPSLCPHSKSCYPASVRLGANEAGVCAGILHKSDNLDCIGLCVFVENLKIKKIDYIEHFMTPAEALDEANALIWAVSSALDFASIYQKFHNELVEARKNGDKSPNEY
jgi:hypothetical protein